MLGKKQKQKDPEISMDEDADSTEGKKDGESGDDALALGLGGKKKSKKKMIILILAGLAMLGGAGGGLYFSGVLGKKQEHAAVELGPDGKPIEKPVFYTLPAFLINLNSQGKAASFLKATVVIEVAHQEDVPQIEANLPRAVDALNTYLRELRPSDLAGSAGIQRLREELLLRVNKALAPIKVNDVLFKEIVVQ